MDFCKAAFLSKCTVESYMVSCHGNVREYNNEIYTFGFMMLGPICTPIIMTTEANTA